MSAPERPTCLIYSVLPYNGIGWLQTCVSIVEQFADEGIDPVLVLPRSRRQMHKSIRVMECLPFPLSRLPWKFVESLGEARVERQFGRLLRGADPDTTIAYFWPGVPKHVIQQAGKLGIMSVREMINCHQGTAKALLDAAYDRLDLPRRHSISEEAVADERQELALYDHVFASNANCEASLREAGVEESRILPSAYGWSPSRFEQTGAGRQPSRHVGPRFLFVGRLSVRKGVPELLVAWEKSRLPGELVLVGEIEPTIAHLVAAAVAGGKVRHVPFTSDLSSVYASSDVFLFPSHEEGGPQVVMEAAAHGLPIIATPMGGGRILRDGINGLLVRAGDAEGLSAAIVRLASDPNLVRCMSEQIAKDAAEFTYPRIGRERAKTLMALLDKHKGAATHVPRPVMVFSGRCEHAAQGAIFPPGPSPT